MGNSRFFASLTAALALVNTMLRSILPKKRLSIVVGKAFVS
jgi:hypothetical protein